MREKLVFSPEKVTECNELLYNLTLTNKCVAII